MCLEIESEYVQFPYQILLKKNEFGDTALFDEKLFIQSYCKECIQSTSLNIMVFLIKPNGKGLCLELRFKTIQISYQILLRRMYLDL